ncbi:MAG: hypothetical protein ACLGHW_00395 [Gammaproteobacteria bacterium]
MDGLATLLIASFAMLLWSGGQIRDHAAPIPERVLADDGTVVYTRADIERGRQVWQSMGGMQLGSTWGHGAYVAPDWSADWLHREAVGLLDMWAHEDGGMDTYADLPAGERAALQGRLQELMRRNTYNPDTREITLTRDRVAVISNVSAHYESLFGNDPATAELREAYAMKNNTVPDAAHRRDLAAFFWWTAWAATTERPTVAGETLSPDRPTVEAKRVTYTNNWPGEPLVGYTPPPSTWVWSAFSVLFLLAGIALLGWYHAVTHREDHPPFPARDPLAALVVTPSGPRRLLRHGPAALRLDVQHRPSAPSTGGVRLRVLTRHPAVGLRDPRVPSCGAALPASARSPQAPLDSWTPFAPASS